MFVRREKRTTIENYTSVKLYIKYVKSLTSYITLPKKGVSFVVCVINPSHAGVLMPLED